MAATRKPRYREVTVVVTLRVHRAFSVAEAKREMKTRVNDLCGHYTLIGSGRPFDFGHQVEESDVRIKRISKWPT